MRGDGAIWRRVAGRELHAALIAVLLPCGCSLVVGSELSSKPSEATGGGAGGQGGSSAQSSSAQASSGPTTSAGGPSSSSAGGPSSSSAGGSSSSSAGGPSSSSAGGGASSSSASSGSGGPMCPDDFADCDGKLENGCEANLATDKHNCGVCNHKCMGGEKCDQKQCN